MQIGRDGKEKRMWKEKKGLEREERKEMGLGKGGKQCRE